MGWWGICRGVLEMVLLTLKQLDGGVFRGRFAVEVEVTM